jgi:uncharacterized membrane protein YhaH (DUF805 family)
MSSLLFSFRGRIGRIAFLTLALAPPLVVSYVWGTFALWLSSGNEKSDPILVVVVGGMFLWMFVLLWIFLAAATRRCHDLGISGLFVVGFTLVNLLLFAGSMQTVWIARVLFGVAFLVIAVLPGAQWNNRFGAPPATLFSVGDPTKQLLSIPMIPAEVSEMPEGEPVPLGSRVYEHGGRIVIIHGDGKVRARNAMGWRSFSSLDAYREFVGEKSSGKVD